ncbi:WRKY transcription factor WRKY24-like [Phragmites australis]|uniref:WRKY transcription factor WRKY24-like n=1 Tax=Phragmites australis TaxID=29695 RepID=UPI002D767F63|nr:WRKY transcription factor WRKY24-like [Phragmites australis]
MYMAASLGLGHGHETYSYPPAGSSYFHPGPVADNGAVLNFPPPAAMADYFPELGLRPSDYYSPPPVFANRAAATTEDEMNMSCGDVHGRMVSGSAGNGGRPSSRIGFRTRSEVDVLDDGFKWRKYGKKAVKSSPNPRNYYRCSVEGCGVKKRVERDRDDPRYVVTTYDGVHNHDAPGCGPGAYPTPRSGAPPPTAYSATEPSGFAAPSDAWAMQLHAAAAAHSSESSY